VEWRGWVPCGKGEREREGDGDGGRGERRRGVWRGGGGGALVVEASECGGARARTSFFFRRCVRLGVMPLDWRT